MTGTESRLAGSPAGPAESPRERSAPRIVLSGATGRLGRSFAEVAAQRGWTLVGGIAGPTSVAAGRTLSSLGVPGGSAPLRSSDALEELLAHASVYVACGPAIVESRHLPTVARLGVPAVIATTGFTEAEEAQLAEFTRQIPIVREANFSVGLHWVRSALARSLPLPEGFDVGLLEAHRIGKRDRPSGTARQLAIDLQGRGTARPGADAASVIPPAVSVESLRLGDLPGVHQVWVAGRSELIRIEHLVLDRRAFAEGIAEAVQWLSAEGSRRAPGDYRLADVLEPSTEGP
jgi:4-hydroxy-tetrahydrodipicolinate reductase